jgi:hypothetical protein
MSVAGNIIAQVEARVAELLEGFVSGGGSGDGASTGDVTQLKRENTGLRTRLKDVEERLAAVEKQLRVSGGATASAGSAAAAGTAHGVK